jgi:hypothetical protein
MKRPELDVPELPDLTKRFGPDSVKRSEGEPTIEPVRVGNRVALMVQVPVHLTDGTTIYMAQCRGFITFEDPPDPLSQLKERPKP